MLEELILQAQSGSEAAWIEIISKFKPLLKKYAHKLKYEDAYFDLQADFVQLILMLKIKNIRNKSDGGLVNYIYYSIKNCYAARSTNIRKFQNESLFSELSEGEMYHLGLILSSEDSHFDIEISSMWPGLTKSEQEVLYLHYINDFSIEEIAISRNVSRQAVNKTKLNALKKMRNGFQ